MTNEKFNSYGWHDALIKKVDIDRTNPGRMDVIEISVCWTNGITQTLLFKNVYKAILDFNFGVIADESINDADVMEETDKDLMEVKHKWQQLYPEIEGLKGYEIRISSTGSKLRIFAMSLEII